MTVDTVHLKEAQLKKQSSPLMWSVSLYLWVSITQLTMEKQEGHLLKASESSPVSSSVTTERIVEDNRYKYGLWHPSLFVSSFLLLSHLDSLVMTRIKAPFSSFSLWFSSLRSALTWGERAQDN